MQTTCKKYSHMISVKIIQDTRSTKKDGTHPLKLRIVYNRQTHHIALGYSVLTKDWDIAGQKVKKSCKSIPNTTRLNTILNREKQKVLDVSTRLHEHGQLNGMSFSDLRHHIVAPVKGNMLGSFVTEIVEEMRKAGKHGNARVYNTMVRSIQSFNGGDILLKQITFTWLKKYEAWYLGKGNSVNSLSVQLRTLRAVYNRAIKQKLVSRDLYPFADYSIQSEETRKRALSHDDLEKLRSYSPKTKREQWAKDYFFMSFYLMGASFIDLAFLRYENILNGRVEYKRKKTGKLHSIKITDQLQRTLARYVRKDAESTDFVLNILSSEDSAQQYRTVQTKLRLYNRTLKHIGKEVGIVFPLTSYVSRHTFATIAKYKGVPTAVISEALGHSSEQVTQVYLDSFDSSVLDSYNELIIGEE